MKIGPEKDSWDCEQWSYVVTEECGDVDTCLSNVRGQGDILVALYRTASTWNLKNMTAASQADEGEVPWCHQAVEEEIMDLGNRVF